MLRFRLPYPVLLACAALLLIAGCPPHEKEHRKAPLTPETPIVMPARGKLLDFAKLHLGMSSVEISQVYNAPEGKGAGFTRVVQDLSDVQHHIVTFESKPTEPQRKLVLALYKDQLYEIVERRDGLTATSAQDWHSELTKQFGPSASESVAGAQWNWGPENGVLLTYTQDNASDKYMSANVVLVFKPFEQKAYDYLVDWQKAHPEFAKEQAEAEKSNP